MPSIFDHLRAHRSAAADTFERAHLLAEVDRSLKEMLGDTLSARSRLANLRDGVAVLHADSATTLTALRFRSPEILRLLQSRTALACERLEIKIDPTLLKKQPARL